MENDWVYCLINKQKWLNYYQILTRIIDGSILVHHDYEIYEKDGQGELLLCNQNQTRQITYIQY
ncbi:unnamed protein product [Paramecium pentaurelia]|uniref:Uncharacterized protein n=1 Tax=Paramecium pentaurelia TaxID=43138 RepID=A0A8S1SLA3_9CILI|nr:unnamed protein product [Paramecium pentaurelia]